VPGTLTSASMLLTLVACALGVVFTASLCVVFVTAYIYLYLTHNE
jgi:hypothetical protein